MISQEKNESNPGERINVVLVRSIYPRNVGMCARAMANMGVSRLVLVAPQCEITEDAKQGATKAQKVLREAVVYPSLSAFYEAEGDGVRIALSGRAGKLRLPEQLDLKLESLASMSQPQILEPGAPIYLLFGPEDDGLNDDEIKDAHHVCSLPTFGEFFSMNLSHATMLTLYIVRSFLARHQDPRVTDILEAAKATRRTGRIDSPKSEGELRKEQLKAQRAPKYFPEKTIQTWLEVLGFELDTRRVNAGRIINRILLENEPTQDELRILEAVVQQTIRKLRTSDASSD